MPSDRREILSERLIEAALARIAENGLDALRARDLARDAGVAVGSIYTAFRDMDALVLEVNARTFRALHASVVEAVRALGDAPPIDQLICMGNAYYDYAMANESRWSALFLSHVTSEGDTPDWYRAEVGTLFAIIARPVRALRPDLGEDEVPLMARALFAAVHGIVMLSVQDRVSAIPRDQVRPVMEMMIRSAMRT